MTLTTRQRTKVNAALCLIHDNGHDASAIIKVAKAMTKEVGTRKAYELALNDFIRTQPDLHPAIAKMHKLVDASNDATVDQYDTALSEYVSTGDDSSLNALAPTIAEDSLALAVRDGEITQEEADSGEVAKALGFEPGPALIEAVAARAEQANEQQPGAVQEQPKPNQPMWQSKTQADKAPQLGDAPASPAQSAVNGSQQAFGNSPTGMVAAGWARNVARNTGQMENGDGAQAL
jgi:hypothetical protein